jgi:hypothetical protein
MDFLDELVQEIELSERIVTVQHSLIYAPLVGVWLGFQKGKIYG